MESAIGKIMRNTSLVLFALAVSCGCGRLPTPRPGSHEAARAFLLRYKFSPGEERRYLLRASFSSQTLGEGTERLSVEHEAELRQNVLAAFPNAGARVTVVIDKLRFVMSAPGREVVEFNSDDAESVRGCPQEMRGIAFLVGKEIEIEQRASGEVVDVSGLTPIYEEALDELSLKERQPVERLLREMAFKPSALLGLDVILPEQAIRLGESWSAEGGPFPVFCGRLAYRCDYLFREVSDGQAIVEFRGDRGAGEVQPGSKMQQVRNAKVQGALSFDLDEGILTGMRGESSSFLRVGDNEQLRTKATWQLTLQKPPRMGQK